MNNIYSIVPSSSGVALKALWTDSASNGFAAGYTSMAVVKLGEKTILYAYNKDLKTTGVYVLSDAAPWVARADVHADLAGGPWDMMSSFVLGNTPYLMTYSSEDGAFGFFAVHTDLTVSKPYDFVLPRNTPTKGFTMVAPYSSVGMQYFSGYSFDTGIVANFSLAVTATSPADVPPLLALNVWYHQWAKGWSHFAFFQMGGANFFFKINRDKLNVNIDHMQDNPAMGSVEVGSYLQAQLPDALKIDSTAAIPWADGEPYLATYVAATGEMTIYRIHVDCQGWTSLCSATTVARATQTVPYRIGGTSFLLFYAA